MKQIITIFGSSDISEDTYEYNKALRFGELLGRNGFDIVTGGYGA